MENIYAALLLHKAGKEVNEENLKSIVSAAGVNIDEAKIKSLVASLKGVEIDKELENAQLAISSTNAPVSASAKESTEEKTEEKKEEEKAPAAEGLSALFG